MMRLLMNLATVLAARRCPPMTRADFIFFLIRLWMGAAQGSGVSMAGGAPSVRARSSSRYCSEGEVHGWSEQCSEARRRIRGALLTTGASSCREVGASSSAGAATYWGVGGAETASSGGASASAAVPCCGVGGDKTGSSGGASASAATLVEGSSLGCLRRL